MQLPYINVNAFSRCCEVNELVRKVAKRESEKTPDAGEFVLSD